MSEESIKLAVLEQKLLDFSNIVHKLDDAIQKLSEVNANITRMLAVHDERIEQCNKSDSILIKMIDEIKKENEEDHQQVIKRIESIENEIEVVKNDLSEIKMLLRRIVKNESQ